MSQSLFIIGASGYVGAVLARHFVGSGVLMQRTEGAWSPDAVVCATLAREPSSAWSPHATTCCR